MKERNGWIFEKLKTKKGCDSYFDSCHPTYEGYLREKAKEKRLIASFRSHKTN